MTEEEERARLALTLSGLEGGISVELGPQRKSYSVTGDSIVLPNSFKDCRSVLCDLDGFIDYQEAVLVLIKTVDFRAARFLSFCCHFSFLFHLGDSPVLWVFYFDFVQCADSLARELVFGFALRKQRHLRELCDTFQNNMHQFHVQ